MTHPNADHLSDPAWNQGRRGDEEDIACGVFLWPLLMIAVIAAVSFFRWAA